MDFASLQHSVFLQALGSSILNSLWQIFIIWLIYETIGASYKNASSKFKNNLGTILLFLSFTLFVSGFISKIINHQTALPEINVTTGVTVLPAVQSPSAFQQFLFYIGSVLPYLSVAYIFLLFFLMAKLFTAYRYVYIISNQRLLNPPGELNAFADKVSKQMQITRKISVWVSQHIDVPATIGFIKPIILIPFASVNNLSGEQLEAIVLHELSHIRRNDYLINIIIAVIETILFFNPFVVLLSKAVKRERENCCDDFVLEYRYDPHSYASALLRLEQSRATNLKLAIGAVSGKKQLLSRIKRITGGTVVSRQFNYGQKLLALLLVTGIICSVAWLSPGDRNQMNNTSKENPEVKKVSKADTLQEVLGASLIPQENAKSLKPNSKKKEVVPLKLSIAQGLLQKVTGLNNFNFNEVFSTTYDENPSLAKSLEKSQYLFNASELKLPRSINIKNFPFQNSSFSIDLGKLNENLKLAYKAINEVDWNKVQNDIRESFSHIKIQDFPSKEQTEFWSEKAKEFSKLKEFKQKFDTTKELKKEIKLQDSLLSKRMIFVYNNNVRRTQRDYQREQQQYAQNLRELSRINYANNQARSSSSGRTEEDNEAVCINGDNNLLTSGGKNVKISIIKSPGIKGDVHQKKFLQFSFGDDKENPAREHVINVEVTDLP